MPPSAYSNIHQEDPVELTESVVAKVPPPRYGRTNSSVLSSVAFGIPGGRISTAGRSLTADIGLDAVDGSKIVAHKSNNNVVVTNRRSIGSTSSKRSNRRNRNSSTILAESNREQQLHQEHQEQQQDDDEYSIYGGLYRLLYSDSGRSSLGGHSSGA